MPSLKQLIANRLNAKKSSGPKTSQGKMRASVNAVRHGLSASKFVTVLESAEVFQELHERFIKDWKPRGVTQEMEVERLAKVYWQIDRAQRALSEVLNTEICAAIDSRAVQEIRTTISRLEELGRPRRSKDDQNRKAECLNMQGHYENLLYAERKVKRIMRSNSLGIGAALSRLGAKGDKLSTIMRYLAHFERAAQRIVQNLMMLKK